MNIYVTFYMKRNSTWIEEKKIERKKKKENRRKKKENFCLFFENSFFLLIPSINDFVFDNVFSLELQMAYRVTQPTQGITLSPWQKVIFFRVLYKY